MTKIRAANPPAKNRVNAIRLPSGDTDGPKSDRLIVRPVDVRGERMLVGAVGVHLPDRAHAVVRLAARKGRFSAPSGVKLGREVPKPLGVVGELMFGRAVGVHDPDPAVVGGGNLEKTMRLPFGDQLGKSAPPFGRCG
jgi:hypothetical protein